MLSQSISGYSRLQGFKRPFSHLVGDSTSAHSCVNPIRVLTAHDSLIEPRTSYSGLPLTRELFDTLMASFDVFPRFKEFVILFGRRYAEREIAPPDLRFRRLPLGKLGKRTSSYAEFGNSSSQLLLYLADCLDCAYGLRYVELNNRSKAEPWSIRQTAICHKYKSDTKSSSWVIVSASPNTKGVLERYISSSKDLASLKAFEFHLLMIDTALANWPQYIVDLTDNISKQVSRSFLFVQTSATSLTTRIV